MSKISVSISRELDSAITWAAMDAEESKSSLIETYLREHTKIKEYIALIRKGAED